MARAAPTVPDLTCFAHLTLMGFYDFQYRGLGRHIQELSRVSATVPRQLRVIAPPSSIFSILCSRVSKQDLERSRHPSQTAHDHMSSPAMAQGSAGERQSAQDHTRAVTTAATNFSTRARVVSCGGHRICRAHAQRPRLKAPGGRGLLAAERRSSLVQLTHSCRKGQRRAGGCLWSCLLSCLSAHPL
jgi:hypothetical protein